MFGKRKGIPIMIESAENNPLTIKQEDFNKISELFEKRKKIHFHLGLLNNSIQIKKYSNITMRISIPGHGEELAVMSSAVAPHIQDRMHQDAIGVYDAMLSDIDRRLAEFGIVVSSD